MLAVAPFATRALGRVGYADVAFGLVLVQIVYTVAAAGIPQLVLREHHRPGDGPAVARSLAGAMFVAGAGLAVAGTALALVVAALVGGSPWQWVALAWSAAGLTCVAAGQAVARARQRPLDFVLLAVLSTVGAQGAGVLVTSQGPSATADAYLGAYAVVLALCSVAALRVARPRIPRREPRVVAALRDALPLLPQSVAMAGLLMGDVAIAQLLGPPGTAGTYNAALTTLGNMPFVLATAFYNAWSPMVFARPEGTRRQYTATTCLALAAVVGAGGAGVSLLSPWLVPVLAPPEFDHQAMVAALGPMCAVAVCYMLYQAAALTLVDVGRTERLLWSALVALVVLAVAGTALLATWGVPGLALARLLAYAVLAIASLVLAWRSAGLVWPTVPLVGVLAGVAALTALGSQAGTDGAGLVARLGSCALIAIAGLVAVGVAARSGAWSRR